MRRALEIACAALDEPESRRRSWAEGQCGDDQTLRQEVIALLAADDRPERVLRSTVSERAREPISLRWSWPGTSISRLPSASALATLVSRGMPLRTRVVAQA